MIIMFFNNIYIVVILVDIIFNYVGFYWRRICFIFLFLIGYILVKKKKMIVMVLFGW